MSRADFANICIMLGIRVYENYMSFAVELIIWNWFKILD